MKERGLKGWLLMHKGKWSSEEACPGPTGAPIIEFGSPLPDLVPCRMGRPNKWVKVIVQKVVPKKKGK